MVLLTRLSPVFPFVLLNYFLGLTAVRTPSYGLANLLGMLPGPSCSSTSAQRRARRSPGRWMVANIYQSII